MPPMLTEGVLRGGGLPRTLALVLVFPARGAPATDYDYYIALPIIRVISEGLTGPYNCVLGGSPLPPLYCPPHPVMAMLALKFGESLYAAARWEQQLRLPKSSARMRARTPATVKVSEANELLRRCVMSAPPRPCLDRLHRILHQRRR